MSAIKIMKNFNVISKNFMKISSLLRFHSKSYKSLASSTFTNNSVHSNQNEQNKFPSVVIIGAGMAGLTAADILLQNGIKNIKILEATGRYGGRIYSKKWHSAICELGSKCVSFPFAVNETTISEIYGDVYFEHNQNSRSDFQFFKSDGNLIDHNVTKSVRKEFASLRGCVDDMRLIINSTTKNVDQIVKNVQKQCPNAKQEDVICVINAVLNTMRSRFGTDLQNVNLDLCKHKIVTTKKIELPFGCSSFFNLLKISAITELITFDSPVLFIKRMYHYPERFITTVTVNGLSIDSDYVICTIPHGTLNALQDTIFDPPLPNDRIQSMQKIGVGNVERIFLMFEKSISEWFQGPVTFAWRPNELANRSHFSTGVCTVKALIGSENILEITVAGFQAEDICLASDDSVMTDVHKTLKKFLGNSQIPYPLDILRSRWSKDICSLGSVVYPSQNTTINDLMKQEETADFNFPDQPRLLFAGDATIMQHFGTIHGARLSGIREANRIIESVSNSSFSRNYIK